ncbi:MAG: pyridoxal-phosphate dependent enzyme, partial [Gammaproteobacteria bacterium]
CAQKGYPLVVTMAESFSVERRQLMRFLGAKVVLTPAAHKGIGMVNKAKELAEKHGWWQSHQFENPANAAMHERTTAQEILRDFDDLPLDYWVTGSGTGGTLCGVSRVLRAKSPQTKIIVCEPEAAPLFAHGVKQERHADGSPSVSHPDFKSHPLQGWTPDFIPLVAQEALDAGRVDRILPIAASEAMRCSKALAQQEGIFVGISAGATLSGALQVAQSAAQGSTILCMLPDTGERYLSTLLFEDVEVEMSEAERAIAVSTPNYQL